MDEERLTKKEKKELRKQERLTALSSKSSQNRQGLVTWGVIALAAILFLGFFSFLVFSAKQSRNNVTIVPTGWVRGDVNAKNTLYEFGDLQCPACKRYEPFVEQASKDFKGKIKFVFKHFPLSQVHRNAMSAAITAEAAGAQGKFWEMHDLLYQKQEEWGESTDASKLFGQYANDLKLDITKFKADLKDKSLSDKITTEQTEGINLGVSATPTFYLNNKMLDLSATYDEFKKEINAGLIK